MISVYFHKIEYSIHVGTIYWVIEKKFFISNTTCMVLICFKIKINFTNLFTIFHVLKTKLNNYFDKFLIIIILIIFNIFYFIFKCITTHT